MTVFIALLLAVLSVALIAYPFFRAKPRAGAAGGDRQRESYARRDITSTMLQELESDYQSGILTEEEYKELEASYRQKADSISRGIGRTGKTSPADDEIEKRVQELRQKKGAPQPKTAPVARRETKSEDEIERQVRELRQKKQLTCPRCGQTYREGDRFCSRCGASLAQEGGR